MLCDSQTPVGSLSRARPSESGMLPSFSCSVGGDSRSADAQGSALTQLLRSNILAEQLRGKVRQPVKEKKSPLLLVLALETEPGRFPPG